MTFEEFSEMNRRRCESYNGFGESLQAESKYTLAHWALSISSEAGEVCDAILGWEGLKARRAGKTKEDVAKECADVITYCDLTIQKLGYNTCEILAKKFNEVNERCGFGARFALAAPPAGVGAEPDFPPPTPEQLDAAVAFIVGQSGDDQTRMCTCNAYPHLPSCGETCRECGNEPMHGTELVNGLCDMCAPAGTGGRR